MKRAVPFILFLFLLSASLVWTQDRDDAPKPAQKSPDEKAGDEESEGSKITHDTNGNVVITMSDDTQGDAGIVVTNPALAQWNPEIRGYGRVLDPSPLAALVNELATDHAAFAATSKELDRLKTLSEQSNASARSLDAASAAALRDQLAIQSARDRLQLSWGAILPDEKDLVSFIQPLIARKRVLVRLDLSAGQKLDQTPTSARLVTLSGNTADATFLGPAPATDPQLQGQGFFLSADPNPLSLAFGQSVSGYLKLPGQPITGVEIPRDSIVRAEGAAWVYVMNSGGESFTRREITLDRPTADGWFVNSGITPEDYIVTTGAQTLLSEELKGALKPD